MKADTSGLRTLTTLGLGLGIFWGITQSSKVDTALLPHGISQTGADGALIEVLTGAPLFPSAPDAVLQIASIDVLRGS